MNEILICGGRLYATGPNYYWMERIFDNSMITLRDAGEFSIVCGDASGADGYARHWAKMFGVECLPVQHLCHPRQVREGRGRQDPGPAECRKSQDGLR